MKLAAIGIFSLVVLAGCADMQPNQVDWSNFKPFQPIPNFVQQNPVRQQSNNNNNYYQTTQIPNASWTGKQTMVETVTHQQAWECEYYFQGQIIRKVFSSGCPSSITVQ